MYIFFDNCFALARHITNFRDRYGGHPRETEQCVHALEYGVLVQPNSLVSLALESGLGLSLLLSANFSLN